MTQNPRSTRLIGKVLTVLTAVAALGMVGCAKQQPASQDTSTYATESELNRVERRVERLEGMKGEEGEDYSSKLGEVPADMNRAYMALPTGEESTSVILVEKLMPKSVDAAQAFDYQIKVTNLTDNLSLSNVTVTDAISRNFTYRSSSPQGQSEGGLIEWNLGTLAPEQSKTITVTGATEDVGEAATCAIVDYDAILCLETTAERAEIAAQLEGIRSAVICDDLTYNATITNSGTGVAEDVQVMAQLPGQLTTEDGSSQIRENIGDLGPGESREIPINLSTETPGEYDIMIQVSSANAGTIESQTVTTTVCLPELMVEARGPGVIYLGNQIPYMATVTNTGDCPAEDVTLTANFPNCAGLAGAGNNGSITGQDVTWNLGTLQPGESREVSVRIRAAEKCENENATFVANGYCVDEEAEGLRATAPVQIVGIPAILLEVIDEVDPVPIGQNTTYLITATNQGSALATNIEILAEVEDMTIVNVSGATEGTIEGKRVSFAPFASLEPGAEAVWRVEAKADAAGDQRFAVQMTSDQLVRPVAETESTHTYEYE